MEDIILDTSTDTFITHVTDSESAVNSKISEEETRGKSLLTTIFLVATR